MILSLLATLAWAQTCDELTNMVRADVPEASIVGDMRRSGGTFSRRELACLEYRKIPHRLVDEARRLNDRGALMEQLNPILVAADAEATISVDLYCGSIEVVGTDETSVSITGTLEVAGRLDVEADDPARVTIAANHRDAPPEFVRVDGPAGPPKFGKAVRPNQVVKGNPSCARLRVAVPRKARLLLSTSKATVRALWLHGDLDIRTHFGGITVVGGASEVVATSTSGAIHIDSPAEHVDVRTVSGVVEVAASPSARVQVDTVSGPVWVWGGPIRRAELTTVSGDIHFNGAVEPHGQLLMESHKGNIEGLTPPGNSVRLQTYEGEAITPVPYVRPDSWTMQQEGIVAPDAFGGYTGYENMSTAASGIFRGGEFARWWFADGSVVTRTQDADRTDFTLAAKSFSGDVRLGWRREFPAVSWSVIEPIVSRSEALKACSVAQYERSPAQYYGNGVITLSLSAKGEIKSMDIAAQTFGERGTPEATPTAFPSCLKKALTGVEWPKKARTHVIWPVHFGPPDEGPELSENAMVRPNSVGSFLGPTAEPEKK